ncbi:MAG: hypothetical protein GEV04_22745 [Actinophytocola sp.]|nr:hypothetical protein [Actinophytocola sp.]
MDQPCDFGDVAPRAERRVIDGGQHPVHRLRDGVTGFLFGLILPDNEVVFAFQVLPIVVFVAALSAVLYHLRILQWVVRIIGGALRFVLGTCRAESLCRQHERADAGAELATAVVSARTGASSPARGSDAPGAATTDVPVGEHADTSDDTKDETRDSRNRNVIDAAANGAADGLKLALNIGAMLTPAVVLRRSRRRRARCR